MDVNEIEFSDRIEVVTVAEILEAIARDFRLSKFQFEADGEILRFDVTGPVEFELEADYNPDKKKYSVKLEVDWREA